MKVNQDILKKLIKKSLRENYHLNEIVDYAVTAGIGSKDLVKVDYPECKIEIPPIFKRAFLQNLGADPQSLRRIMKTDFEKLGQTKKGFSEKTIAVFNTIFSDKNIANISKLASQIASAGGVPAVYCVVLQKAIDAFAKLVDMFDSERQDDQEIVVTFITPITNLINSMRYNDNLSDDFKNKFGVNSTTNLSTNPNLKRSVLTLYFADSLLQFQNLMGPSLANTRMNAATDSGMANSLKQSYLGFQQELAQFNNLGDDISSEMLIKELLRIVFKIPATRATTPELIQAYTDLGKKERAFDEQQLKQFRRGMKSKLARIAKGSYVSSFNFVTNKIPTLMGFIDLKDFYMSYTRTSPNAQYESYSTIVAIAKQL